jgi:hypothetical protein
MKSGWRALLWMSGFMAVLAAGAQTVARTPPMGWNSWDAYGLTITEAQFLANVDVLKTKLAPFGWQYAVIDEGWFFENPGDRSHPEKLRYALDSHGRYVPVPARFPSAGNAGKPDVVPDAKLSATIEETGFSKVAARVHAQGLKFGIHIVRGIPRASVERNLPIDGSSFRAQDAADTGDACSWDPTNWGIKDNAAGQAWYDSLLRQYAGWGIDLLKVDCIADHPYKVDEIRMIRRAIDRSGRPMVLSLSPGPTALAHADEVAGLAQMWRISDDIWDIWKKPESGFPQSVTSQFARLAAWSKYAKPGNWPDADMLPFGELKPSPGWGRPRSSQLTPDEVRTQLTLWAIARSPLILGGNLTALDEETLKLLQTRELIRVNQTATASRQLSRQDDWVVWSASLPAGETALAVFNLGDNAADVHKAWSDLGFQGNVRSAKAALPVVGEASAKGVNIKLPPHGSALWILR